MKRVDLWKQPPCERCAALFDAGKINGEMVMPVPPGAMAALGLDGTRCCKDCESADTMLKLKILTDPCPRPGTADFKLYFEMARIAVGNDRRDQLRLPGAKMGLVQAGHVRPSKPGDLRRHHAWLDEHNIDPGQRELSPGWGAFAQRFPTAGADWDAYAAEHQIDSTQPFKLNYADDGLRLTLIDEDGFPIFVYEYSKHVRVERDHEQLKQLAGVTHRRKQTKFVDYWTWSLTV